MSTIQENLDKILHAVFGRDVRQAIHDSIKNCYDDAVSGSSATKALSEKIDKEISDRQTADSSINTDVINLRNKLNTENTAIKESLATEKTARETADNLINESLASHGTRLNALETYTVKVDSEGYIGYTYNGE